MGLFKARPDLKVSWSEKNQRDPQTLTPGSNFRAWWTCEKGHEWDATVKNRTNGSGCPVCLGRKIIVGVNDLATLRPDLAQEWSGRNPKSAQEVTLGSNAKVWWKSQTCGHEWEAVVSKRTGRGSGCIYCAKAGTRILPGFNDLATKEPEIAKEWSPRNEKSASEVFPTTAKKYWWVGARCGHEWEATPANRTSERSGCPFCVHNPQVLSGHNDLATLYPEIAKEWSPRNKLTPERVTSKANRKVWWRCERGHEWSAAVGGRTGRGAGCPHCWGRLYPGENDLETVFPEIARQWNHERNEGKVPSEVTKMSDSRVWWKCEEGHEWRAAVSDRTRQDGKHTGCPRCSSGNQVSRGEREVAEFVSQFVPVETSYRDIPGVFEVDVFAPEQKVAIEFNGLYWHREAVAGKSKHFQKSLSCSEAGVALIYVWEDDWRDRPETVKRMILRKLGKSQEERLNARQLERCEVSSREAREFLEEFHIQGPTGGSFRAGLRDSQGGLRALLVLRKKPSGGMELVRFATHGIVRGGFSRLFKFAVQETGADLITTFSDTGVSDGELYRKAGFRKDGEIPPDYKYVFRDRREHKFNFRKKRFREDPELQYSEGLTEGELAALNGLHRIYDSGKIRWVWEPRGRIDLD